jgi:two-component system sensor histidine kinase AlgZ
MALLADNGRILRAKGLGPPDDLPARSLRPASDMPPIIRQNPDVPTLPDFRNLGTLLRTLVAVNALAAIAAPIREASPAAWPAAWLELTTYVEPHLLLALALLAAASPWLARLPYAAGAFLVCVLTVVAGVVFNALLAPPLREGPAMLLRHLLLSVIVALALLGYFRLRARALSPAIAEARLQALQARIRPHFLFNSINAVLSLVRSNPKHAETALEDMADLFRVLMRDNRGLAPLADEVELCRQYLALEKLRLGDRLQVEWHLNSMPADALVPPLVLQPLLENAIYHGIEPSSAPGVVSINIFYKSGEVHAILRNPYRAHGGEHHAGNKMALANVRERLALHFDAEGGLESKVLRDAWEVHIRMPYRTEAPAARQGGEADARVERGNGSDRAGARRVAAGPAAGALASAGREPSGG